MVAAAAAAACAPPLPPEDALAAPMLLLLLLLVLLFALLAAGATGAAAAERDAIKGQLPGAARLGGRRPWIGFARLAVCYLLMPSKDIRDPSSAEPGLNGEDRNFPAWPE